MLVWLIYVYSNLFIRSQLISIKSDVFGIFYIYIKYIRIVYNNLYYLNGFRMQIYYPNHEIRRILPERKPTFTKSIKMIYTNNGNRQSYIFLTLAYIIEDIIQYKLLASSNHDSIV